MSYIVLCSGLTGTATALLLELGSALYLYPLIVQGKPVNITTIPAFFPVIFELTVLFSAFGAVFGMLAMNLLPRWNHPLFNWDRFVEKATDDGFFVVVEASDPRFSDRDTRDFLAKVGGDEHHRRLRRAVSRPTRPASFCVSYEIFLPRLSDGRAAGAHRGRTARPPHAGPPAGVLPGHGAPGQGQAAAAERVLRRRRGGAPTRRGHGADGLRHAPKHHRRVGDRRRQRRSGSRRPAPAALDRRAGLLRHRQDR